MDNKKLGVIAIIVEQLVYLVLAGIPLATLYFELFK